MASTLPKLIDDVRIYLGIPDYIEGVVKKLRKRYEKSKLPELEKTVEANKQAAFQQSLALMELQIRIITLEAMRDDLKAKEERKRRANAGTNTINET